MLINIITKLYTMILGWPDTSTNTVVTEYKKVVSKGLKTQRQGDTKSFQNETSKKSRNSSLSKVVISFRRTAILELSEQLRIMLQVMGRWIHQPKHLLSKRVGAVVNHHLIGIIGRMVTH